MSVLIEGLPNAVTLKCLAHLPYHLYSELELVNHSWKAALRSPELFKARKEIGLTNEFLCVCAFDPENLWQLYDPQNDIWMTIPRLPTKIRHLAHFGAVSIAGKLFVIGGGSDAVDLSTGDQDGRFATNEVWSYDPATKKWSQCAPMLVPRAMFACCILDGKIVVAGGFTSSRNSITYAEIYDPEKNTWVSIPDLVFTYNVFCFGIAIGGRMLVFHNGLTAVQVLVNPSEGWTVENFEFLQGPIAVVKDVLYTLENNLLYKLERGKKEVVASAADVGNIIGFGMVSLGGDLYVVGGVMESHAFSQFINPTSDVNVLNLESERPVWRRVSPMSRCLGAIRGCTPLIL